MFRGIVRYEKELFRTPDELAVQLYHVKQLLADDENHFRPDSYITVKGYGLPDEYQARKINLEVKGEWTKHPKYGWQVNATGWRESVENSRNGIISFLEKTLNGVGKSTASKIYNAYGNETIRKLKENPDVIRSIPGIPPKTAERAVTSWRENTVSRDVMEKLMPFGISPAICMRIVGRYKEASIDIIMTQPWRLVKEVTGVSFKEADLIVRRLNLPLDTDERIQAAIEYALLQNEAAGSMGQDLAGLYRRTTFLLGREVAPGRITEVRNQMLLDHSLSGVRAGGAYYVMRRDAHDAEMLLAKRLLAVFNAPMKKPEKKDVEESISRAEEKSGMKYSDEQKGAVYKALSSHVMIITGGPGVGKTATLNLMADVFEKVMKFKICLLSPTGKAAKRMSESTGRPAQYRFHRERAICTEF